MGLSIDKDTTLCISISSSAGNFGTRLHNAAFEFLGLNYIYKSFSIQDLPAALMGVRALNIKGCSVSMPFKQAVIPLLDRIDDIANYIGAVNTIVNQNGILCGYNTDVTGAQKALKSINVNPHDRILLLGAGGVSRSLLYALRTIGCDQVCVSNRDQNKVKSLNSIMPFQFVPWDKRSFVSAEVIINATPVGMAPLSQNCPVDVGTIFGCTSVFDVVVNPLDTTLISLARSMGKKVSPGYLMSLEQAMEQFRLYTGREPPRDVMQKSLQNLLAQY